MREKEEYNWKEILILALIVGVFSYAADSYFLSPIYDVAKEIRLDNRIEIEVLQEISIKLDDLKVTITCEK